MENYEEKYKQALEKCKKEFNFSNLAYSHEEIKQKLEYIFPELKKSEDERMWCINLNLSSNESKKKNHFTISWRGYHQIHRTE